MTDIFYGLFLESGNAVVSTWLGVFLLWSILLVAARLFSYVRSVKIQSRPVSWSLVRHELLWSALNVGITSFVLQVVASWLVSQGWLTTNPEPAAWHIIAFEFTLYFFIFDLYFYLVHRSLHSEPLYRWVHKIHHRSLSPNPLSYASMTPLEGIAEGMIIPIFMTVFTVHDASTLFIFPFAALMGLYVHSGFEFAPRWWYRSALTKWIITPMYHDQHHQYFTCNYGAYTSIWDRAFGTLRSKFEQDFDKLKARRALRISDPERAE